MNPVKSEPRPACLDLCAVSDAPERLSELEAFLRGRGCRPVLTTPGRLPDEAEWDAFDVVLLDWSPTTGFPEIPVSRANLVLATCPAVELDNPAVLRAALRAGARDLLPAEPGREAWEDLLNSARARSPDVGLRFVDPESRVERTHELRRETCVIGRDPRSDVVFPQPFISRTHARIERRGTRHRIVDTGSRTGTFVNGERVSERMLSDGDRIQLGGDQGPMLTFTSVPGSVGSTLFECESIFDRDVVNQEVRDIAALIESFLSLDSDLLLEDVLELLLDRVISFVDGDRGVVLLRPLRTNRLGKLRLDSLKCGIARDRNGRTLDERELDINYKIVTDVLRTGCGSVREEVRGTAPAANGHTAAPDDSPVIRSALCVPLKVRGKLLGDEEGPTLIGVLYIDSESHDRPYSPRTLNMLEVLAAEVAMAVHTTRLYEDSLRRRRVEEEMAIAREIQQNIFLEQQLSGEVWQFHGTTSPSDEVGGDFLSCLEIGPDRYSIFVGDVSGKGVPAALFSTMLDGLFHGMVDRQKSDPDLAEVAARLNQFVLSKSRLKKFVTAIFGVLEPDGRLQYVNAGHNPALVLRADGEVQELAIGGTILGMFDQVTYRPDAIDLDAGDVVILYSDGITDARNADGELFGVERLKAIVRSLHDEREVIGGADATWVHGEILQRVGRFLEHSAPHDDVTLLVVMRTIG